MTEEALQEWLVAWVERAGARAEGVAVDVDARLDDLGLGSRDAVALAGELEDLLDRTVSPTVAWEVPTIRELARVLLAPEGADPATSTGTAAPTRAPAAAAAPAPAGAERSGNPGGRVDDDRVAVVGLGCRLPGGIDGPDAFWELLREGRDAVGEVPAGRWESVGMGGVTTVTRRGGFLDDIAGFDAEYFGMTPTESAYVDPQQRMLLEVAVEALRHARIDPATLRGTPAGVFVGISASEYGHITGADLDEVEPWTATGAALSIAANRLSYALDLRGPSLALDTACSSSLVALHAALGSLRAGESSLALVGGVNLLLTPLVTAGFERAGALAADGRCKSFAADADGIGRAEGCGVIVLERLADARARGHRVLAVVAGSGVNSDGRSNGLTAPNPEAQVDVLERAYTAAGVDPAGVDYVEAHGTGTLLGDPIEAGALGRVLGRGRDVEAPLLLGSVKSNLGHLEAAAGVAAVIKVVLALHHGEVPPTLHAATPNPLIDFAGGRLALVQSPRPWPRYAGTARAGVSGFGFGGTNAHVVLEQAPSEPVQDATASSEPRRLQVFGVAGRSAERATAEAHRTGAWLATAPSVAPGVLAQALAVRHTDLHRIAVAAPDAAAAATALRAALPRRVLAGANRPVFVFSGYGQQWAGMGRTLCAEEPVFASAVSEAALTLSEHTSLDVEKLVRAGTMPEGVEATMVTLFALQIGLAALWQSLGVVPAAVLGHSMGEVAAAVVSGALSLADGAAVIAARSRLLASVDARQAGAMAVVDLPSADVLARGHEWPEVEVAVHTAPGQCTVAGPARQVRRLVERVEADGGDAWVLPVTGAGHSAAVEPVTRALRSELASVTGTAPDIAFYGTVHDDPRQVPAFDAEYWAANTRRAVRFTQAVAAALADGHDTFVEIAAHPVASRAVLATAAAEGVGADAVAVVASLRRDVDDALALAQAVAALHAAGHPTVLAAHQPDAPGATGSTAAELPDLPGPAWLHRRHWFEPRHGFAPRAIGPAGAVDAVPPGGAALPVPLSLGDGVTRLWSLAGLADLGLARLDLPGVLALAGRVLDGSVEVTAAALDGAVRDGAALLLSVTTMLPATATATEPGRVRVELHQRDNAAPGGWRRCAHAEARLVGAAAAEPTTAEAVAIDTVVTVDSDRSAAGVLAQLRTAVGEVVGLTPDGFDVDAALVDLGVDSLMATRARHAVERDFGVSFPVRLLLQGLTLRGLAEHIAGELGGGPVEAAAAVGPSAAAAAGATPVRGGRVPPRDPTERLLMSLWERELGADAFGVTDRLAGVGAVFAPDRVAAAAARVNSAVHERVGDAPGVRALLAAATVEAMANLVREAYEGGDDTVVRVLHDGGNERRPLFVFHPAGGPTSVYRPLVDQLDRDLTVYGMERLDDADTVEAKAARYVELVRERQPHGPYRLLGWSLGGVLAGECAQQLSRAGERVELLASIDTILPREDVTVDAAALLTARYQRFATYIGETYGAQMTVPDDIGSHDELTQMTMIGTALATAGVELPAGVLRHQYTSYVDARIAERYTPKPWVGRMILYRADEVEALTTELDPRYHRTDRELGWDVTVADLVVVGVPGNHITMIDRPNVDVLAADLAARLAELDRERDDELGRFPAGVR